MINELKKLKIGKVITEISLEKYTSYRLKEKAKVMVIPNNEKSLCKLLKFLKDKNYKYKIIGGGSNLIFESYYDGILIKLENLDKMVIKDNIITVESGYNLMKLAMKVSKLGLTGLEFATGIPGTVGGAVVNNSGAYKSDMGYIVKKVKALTPDLKYKEFSNREIEYHYRTSYFKKNPGYIILECVIELQKGNKDDIIEIINDRKSRRIKSQPLEYPSAGSVFRNPPGLFAGELIEKIGYKGKNINDAYVSDKHANFIVNKGQASGKDIVNLINEVKKEVKEKYNVELILEQEIVK